MGKTIADVYEEVIASAELREEYLAAERQGEDAIVTFAAAHGCEATAEEIREFVRAKFAEDEEGEIALADLDQVAGGSGQEQKETIQIKDINIQIDNDKINCQIDGKVVDLNSINAKKKIL